MLTFRLDCSPKSAFYRMIVFNFLILFFIKEGVKGDDSYRYYLDGLITGLSLVNFDGILSFKGALC